MLPVFRVETSGLFNSETRAFRVNLFQLLYSTFGRLEEFIVEIFGVKPSEYMTSVGAFYRRLFIRLHK